MANIGLEAVLITIRHSLRMLYPVTDRWAYWSASVGGLPIHQLGGLPFALPLTLVRYSVIGHDCGLFVLLLFWLFVFLWLFALVFLIIIFVYFLLFVLYCINFSGVDFELDCFVFCMYFVDIFLFYYY